MATETNSPKVDEPLSPKTRPTMKDTIRRLLTTLPAAVLAGSLAAIAAPTQIVFTSNRSGNLDICKMNRDGTGLQQLTTSTDDEYGPMVSPDGRQIAYWRNIGANTQLRVMNIDGSNDRLIKTTGRPAWALAWLPDCSGLVCALPPECSAKLYRVLLDGTTSVFLDPAAVGQGQMGSNISFSRDGTKIAFSAQVGCWSPTMEVYVAPYTNGVVNTSAIVRLTSNSASDAWQWFSPDGRQLVYMHVLGANGYAPPNEVLIRNADGSGTAQRIANSLFDPYPTAWSADGAILLTGRPVSSADHARVWMINPDGTGLTALTSADSDNYDAQWVDVPASPCGSPLLLWENFRNSTLHPYLSVLSTGTFNSPPGIKHMIQLGSPGVFGFGKSTCGANCFDNFVTHLKVTFPTPMWIDCLQFKEMELFGNWGSGGNVYYDGVHDDSFWFSRQQWNDGQPDTTYRTWTRPVNRMVQEIDFCVSDITSASEVFLGDLAIFGSPTHSDLQMCASLNLWGPVNQAYRIEYQTELNGPWTVVTTIVASTSPYRFIDPTSAGQPRRFYRAVPVTQ
jgi:TolB protein